MSRGGDGSDFSDENGGRGGEYLQRGDDPGELHQSKRLKLGGGDSPTRILSLHTDWVQREPGDRATSACMQQYCCYYVLLLVFFVFMPVIGPGNL